MRSSTQLTMNNLELTITVDAESRYVSISIYKWTKANKIAASCSCFISNFDDAPKKHISMTVEAALEQRLNELDAFERDADQEKEVTYINKLLKLKTAKWLLSTKFFINNF